MRSRQEEIDFILDHYDHPRHRGTLPRADVVVRGGNPGCGDTLTYYLRLDAAGRVAEAAFEGEGCTISQAAASVLTDEILGKTLAEITAFNQETLLETLGRDVVAPRVKCATLGLNLLKTAEKQYRAEQAARESA